MWFIIAFIAFFLLAIAAVIDKFLLTKSRIVPVSYAFYAVFLGALASSALLFFSRDFYFPQAELGTLVMGGVAFYFGLYFLFLAVQKSEVSKVNPLSISLTPLFVFLLSLFLAVEFFSAPKFLAILLIILGSYFLSQVGLPKTRLTSQGWLFILATCLMFAVSNTFSKIAYNELSFITAFVWLRWISLATALIFTAVFGGWRAALDLKEIETKKNRQKWLAFAIGQAAGGSGVILMQYAISLGSVTIVTALNGLQFFFVMLIVYVLSKFYPQILREDIQRRFVWQKVFWSLVIFSGVMIILI